MRRNAPRQRSTTRHSHTLTYTFMQTHTQTKTYTKWLRWPLRCAIAQKRRRRRRRRRRHVAAVPTTTAAGCYNNNSLQLDRTYIATKHVWQCSVADLATNEAVVVVVASAVVNNSIFAKNSKTKNIY